MYFQAVGFFAKLLFFYIRRISEHPLKYRIVKFTLINFFSNGIKLASKDKVKFHIPAYDWISHQLITYGIYEEQSIQLAKNLIAPGDIFIDVGANMGLYTCILGKIENVHVHAFEPGSISFTRLEKNVRLNDIKAILNHYALSSCFSLNQYNVDWTYNMGAAKICKSCKTEKISIQILSLDLNQYIKENIKENIKLIKIDVEGHEHKVLEGIIPDELHLSIDNIILEFKENEPNNPKLFNEIRRLGYLANDIFGKPRELTESSLKNLPECNLWLKKI